MASHNRKFITCAPIEGAWAQVKTMPRIPGFTALALLYRDSYYIPDGLLVAHDNGTLAHFQGGALRSIDQRKARAALAAMEARTREGKKHPPYFDRPENEDADDAPDES